MLIPPSLSSVRPMQTDVTNGYPFKTLTAQDKMYSTTTRCCAFLSSMGRLVPKMQARWLPIKTTYRVVVDVKTASLTIPG